MARAPVKPGALLPGQTVGLVAPSFALEDPAALDRAVGTLEALGYRVRVGGGCRAREGGLAGPDALRLADINRMFRDDTVDAILCLRGGYGAMRLLDGLDYGAIRANPKVFCGYSDITALHSAILSRAGVVTFHGPMAASDFDGTPEPLTVQAFQRVTGADVPAGPLDNPPGLARYAVSPGRARGPLIGGNLSLVTACLGTPYAFDFDGAILLLEEIGEKTYALDRMLAQLRLAGALERVAGIVLGAFTNCRPVHVEHFTARQALARHLGHLPIPVLAGVQCGHVAPTLTLPLGVPCAIDADAGTLEILESAVV